MKTLFVRALCPNPIAYGSEMRSSRLVDFLGRKGQVDLLTLSKPTDKSDAAYIQSKFKNFFHFDQNGPQQRLNAFEKLTGLLPWQLTEFYSKDIQTGIDKVLAQNAYDCIFIYKLSPLLYFLRQPADLKGRTVIDFDDILSDLYLNYYKNYFTARKNSYSLRFYEQKALQEFRRVFVCSKDAVSKVPGRLQTKTAIIPNVFEASVNSMMALPAAKDRLLFVGSLDYFPNTEGLKWFFAAVWPQVKTQYPQLKMSVVGKSPREPRSLLESFGNPADVDVAVNVPDVRPYYELCFASVVPLLNGSGTRLKILESAAFGRPVITTLKGMEGLDFTDAKDIFLFHDGASFAGAYGALLDGQKYASVRTSAFDLLQKEYSPAAFERDMDDHWKSIQEAGNA